MSGIISRFKSNLGLLLNTNSYGLKLSKLGVLNVLYANVANGKYFGHICPRLVKCLVRIVAMT